MKEYTKEHRDFRFVMFYYAEIKFNNVFPSLEELLKNHEDMGEPREHKIYYNASILNCIQYYVLGSIDVNELDYD